MNNVGLPISTDQLESLFGIAKHHGTGEVKDANRIATRLSALCGTFTMDDARKVLDITVQQQQELMSTDTLIKQRQQVLAHPGALETLLSRAAKQYIELISGPKNREKINVTHCNIYNIDDFNGPFSEMESLNENNTDSVFESQRIQINPQKLGNFADG